jgi:hypothetical protein
MSDSNHIISNKTLLICSGICLGISATCFIMDFWQGKQDISIMWFKVNILGLQKCRICSNYDRCYQCAINKHKFYCISCLKDWIWMKRVHNVGTADINLPCLDSCGAKITLHRLQGVLPTTDYHAYCEGVSKTYIAKQNMYWCRCGNGYWTDNSSCRIFQCKMCGLSTCGGPTGCGEVVDDNHQCKKSTLDNYSSCQQCGIAIEKIPGGCDRVRCTVCNELNVIERGAPAPPQ